MRKAAIVGDVQTPFHDPSAVAVALQIIEAFKPDIFVANGDWVEFSNLSLRYQPRSEAKKFAAAAKDEVDTTKGILGQFAQAVGPKCEKHFNEGNHEWRLFRALNQIPQIVELMGLPEVKNALCIESILGLKQFGFQYSGEYPAGCWLFGLQKHKDLFVHHGYMVRIKGGYQASAETDKRMVSTCTGHGERLAMAWRRDVTDRDMVGIEGGNLSRLGEPGIGSGIYGSVPMNAPEMLDRCQGFAVVYQDGDLIAPTCVKIKKGKAIFEGKLYKS